ncbi:MAG TPA: cation:proton antiporter [Candidatus Acetothermia bacterium]|nr:cation:proton antiporter [Candidatus Acetothermia bacterium]HEX32552.1 cation:proton antiporter [Candidatus Acetothermia bacterium]
MISNVLIGIGLFFVVIGTIGILRFRDVYSRLQASGVSDNAGLGLILIGLIVRSGFSSDDLKLWLLLFLLLLTNPIITHSIAKSAFVMRHGREDDVK